MWCHATSNFYVEEMKSKIEEPYCSSMEKKIFFFYIYNEKSTKRYLVLFDNLTQTVKKILKSSHFINIVLIHENV